MNRIVREHYPVSNLPEDLREGLPAGTEVTVTVDAAPYPERVDPDKIGLPTADGHFSRFRHIQRSNYDSIENVVDYVRSLRDEWSDRER